VSTSFVEGAPKTQAHLHFWLFLDNEGSFSFETQLTLVTRLKMASSNAPDGEAEPPRKRQRITPPSTSPSTSAAQPQLQGPIDEKKTGSSVTSAPNMEIRGPAAMNGFEPGKEAAVGILCFVNDSNPGFVGTLKQRYVSNLYSLLSS